MATAYSQMLLPFINSGHVLPYRQLYYCRSSELHTQDNQHLISSLVCLHKYPYLNTIYRSLCA